MPHFLLEECGAVTGDDRLGHERSIQRNSARFSQEIFCVFLPFAGLNIW